MCRSGDARYKHGIGAGAASSRQRTAAKAEAEAVYVLKQTTKIVMIALLKFMIFELFKLLLWDCYYCPNRIE